MNEEELKKGCGRYIKEEDRDCGQKYGYYKRERRNYIVKKSGYDLWLCPTCQAKLEGFQKGKLEQKKEELKFLKERCIYCMIADERIKQLQKEIHSQQNPTQSNGSMNNGLGTSSADTKEIGEEKQDE